MKTPPELPAQPAARGARWLALRFLADAADAHARLGGEDATALKDFRVALRRLRSHLRALRGPLEGAVRGRDRRRVRALAHATGDSRDAEVAIAWVDAVLPELGGDERAGADRLLARLEERKAAADARLWETVEAEFPREHRRLAARLGVYRSSVSVEEVAETPSLAQTVAERVDHLAAELRERLEAVRGIDDDERAHLARLAAKRLRYLLEPFARTVPAVGEVVADLKALQQALGEMHDTEVMRDLLLAVEADWETSQGASSDREEDDAGDAGPADDPRPGFRTLARRLYEERGAAWDRIAPAWFGGAADGFFARVDAVRRTLAGRDGVETERKFLLRAFPTLPAGAVEERIEQGWIPGERLHERIRRTRGADGERFYRTVKVGTGITRVELEEETTRDVFRRLWPLTRGRRVAKRRYTVADGGLVWEIDRFTDRRLFLAEVELPSEDTPAEPPAWLAAVLDREVTGEREYVNLHLAR